MSFFPRSNSNQSLNHSDLLINFESSTHSYTNADGKQYISVSELIKYYTPVFDEDGFIAGRVAKSRGCLVSDVLAEWNDKKQRSIDKGNEFHFAAEKLIKKEKLTAREKEITKGLSEFKKSFTGKLQTECRVWNDFYEVAGTTDLVESFKHKVNVYDYKTNEEIKRSSKYNQFLLHDLDFLEDCEYAKYSIQLSLYALLLELSGLKIGKLTILWVDQEYNIHPIPVSYLRHTAEVILHNHLTQKFSHVNSRQVSENHTDYHPA